MTDRPTEPPRPGHQWSRSDFGGGHWFEEKIKPTRGQHPHAKLKADARAALSNWKQRTGISAYYLPYFVGAVLVGDGRAKRKALVGKKGAADAIAAIRLRLVRDGDVVPREDEPVDLITLWAMR